MQKKVGQIAQALKLNIGYLIHCLHDLEEYIDFMNTAISGGVVACVAV